MQTTPAVLFKGGAPNFKLCIIQLWKYDCFSMVWPWEFVSDWDEMHVNRGKKNEQECKPWQVNSAKLLYSAQRFQGEQAQPLYILLSEQSIGEDLLTYL